MLTTYHNHSKWSDGKATIPEIILAANRMGIDELGISDHWVLHPRGTQFSWAMPTDRLPDYVSEIVSLKKNAPAGSRTALKLGLEVDWHPGNAEPLLRVLDQYPFDYIIGSVHEIQSTIGRDGDFMIDGSATAWQKLSQDQIDAIYRQYWVNMKSLAESGVFDIVAHIDLPKKFAFYAKADLSREIAEALDAIASAKTVTGGRLAVEVNTAGWHKPCADAYPTLDILRECRRRDIPMMVNADAHQPEHLLREFDRAAERLATAGFTKVARFNQREMREEPLAEAAPSKSRSVVIKA